MKRTCVNTLEWCSQCSAAYLVTSIGIAKPMRWLLSGSLQHAVLTGLIPSSARVCANCLTPPPSSSPAAG